MVHERYSRGDFKDLFNLFSFIINQRGNISEIIKELRETTVLAQKVIKYPKMILKAIPIHRGAGAMSGSVFL